MTGTLVDLPVERERIAHPTPGARRDRSGAPTLWREAKTVLVAQRRGPREVVTFPRLVIPIGDNQLAFGLSSRSREADELARDSRVLVQPGDWRGTPALGSHEREGVAQLVSAGTLLPYVQSELDAKYRWRVPMSRMFHRLFRREATPYGDAVVLVTVDEAGHLPFLPLP
ncbi:hypothetical protein ACTD5D_16060 [Nocardia takedensis]|uniref:hypothetical protein n=1 Tax=Nocardia takedensis TaxID=259390 RepID=UPI0003087761|nr:hypothetical protein [Nocardia takedensis]